MSQPPQTIQLLGLPVMGGDRVQVLDCLLKRYGSGERIQILTINPEMVIAMRNDHAVAELLSEAEAVVADGVGIEIAARLLGARGVVRYPGVDLAVDLMSRLAGEPVFLLGSRPGIAQQAGRNLSQRISGLNISGCHDGFFNEQDDLQVCELIERTGARILLVGMGSPRQEQFIARARHGCSAKLMVGVGGSLEVYAGVKQRAPKWVRSSGLEWLHRISQDRSRLGRFASLPRFVNLVMREYVGKLNDQVC